MKALLVRPIPYTDESPGSLLLRVSSANGWQRPSRLVNVYLDRNYGAETNLVALFADTHRYNKLCHALGIDAETATNLCYPQNGVGRYAPVIWREIPVQWNALRMKNPAICPHCLKEDGYLRSDWDLRLVTTCTRHKVQLIDTCPSCKKKLTWNRADVGVCK